MMLSNEILKVNHLSIRYEIHKDAFDHTWYLIAFDSNEKCTVKGHEINLIRILKKAEIDFQIPSKNWSGYSIELKSLEEGEALIEAKSTTTRIMGRLKKSFKRV